MAAPPRKYALTRITAGDYLMPWSSGETAWRIARYEDGASHGLDYPRDIEVWGLWLWICPIAFIAAVDVLNWSRWEFHSGLYDTRREAVNAALKAEI